MNEYKVSHEEFDYMLELIAAVLFMAIGIFGIVFMVRQFNRQVQLTPRVDKVRVSSIDQRDSDPFDFTAYQAYMFSWMMDGHDKTALGYFAMADPSSAVLQDPPNGAMFPGTHRYIVLCPAEFANGFLVVRNQAIIGSGPIYGATGGTTERSVKWTIYEANNCNEGKVKSDYRGTDGYGNRWHLDFTDDHVEYVTEERPDGFNLFESRRDYLWSLHPCSPDCHGMIE